MTQTTICLFDDDPSLAFGICIKGSKITFSIKFNRWLLLEQLFEDKKWFTSEVEFWCFLELFVMSINFLVWWDTGWVVCDYDGSLICVCMARVLRKWPIKLLEAPRWEVAPWSWGGNILNCPRSRNSVVHCVVREVLLSCSLSNHDGPSSYDKNMYYFLFLLFFWLNYFFIYDLCFSLIR